MILIHYIRGRSRISVKGFIRRFVDSISFFLSIQWKWNNLVSLRPNYFIFIGYLKIRRQEGGLSETPLKPPLDPPLIILQYLCNEELKELFTLDPSSLYCRYFSKYILYYLFTLDVTHSLYCTSEWKSYSSSLYCWYFSKYELGELFIFDDFSTLFCGYFIISMSCRSYSPLMISLLYCRYFNK